MAWKPIDITKEEIATAVRLFSKKAKFVVDESVDREVGDYLKEKGWNTKTVSEVGLSGHSDDDINTFSYKTKRVILTHDTDFLDDKRFPPNRIYSIIVLPGGAGDLRALAKALNGALSIVGPFIKAYEQSKMWFTQDQIFYVRHRDNKTGRITTSRYKYGGNGPAQIWED